MKIMHVIDSGGFYGAERILVSLIECLKVTEVDCTLVSIAEPDLPEKPLEAEARRRGLEVRRVTMAPGPDRLATRGLIGDAVREGIDLFHTHGYKANFLIAGLPLKKRRLPAVATLHGWTATRRLSRIGIYEFAERFALRRADRVVAVSAAMVRQWKLDGRYGDRLSIIPNGIPVPDRQKADPSLVEKIQGFIGGRPAIFAAGRLSYEKGFDVLLSAVSALRAEGLDACLVLAGEGGERHKLEEQAKELGIEGAVLMPGYVENARTFMASFDAVAIPSRREGLPVVLLEALMAGIPVAATSVGGMPGAMKSCGAAACAKPDDTASLADLLKEKIRDRTDPGKRRDVADQAKKDFSMATMTSSYVDLYRGVQIKK